MILLENVICIFDCTGLCEWKLRALESSSRLTGRRLFYYWCSSCQAYTNPGSSYHWTHTYMPFTITMAFCCKKSHNQCVNISSVCI